MSERAQSLLKLIQTYGMRKGAELGVFRGDTLFKLIAAQPNLFMIGVDAWVPILGPKQDRDTGRASYADHDMPAIGRQVQNAALAWGQRVMIIQHDTADAAKYVPNDFLDFVFVDADHSTEGVMRDVAAWYPKVRTGGIISGHDANWPSVQRALSYTFEAWGEMHGNVWWWLKTPNNKLRIDRLTGLRKNGGMAA